MVSLFGYVTYRMCHYLGILSLFGNLEYFAKVSVLVLGSDLYSEFSAISDNQPSP